MINNLIFITTILVASLAFSYAIDINIDPSKKIIIQDSSHIKIGGVLFPDQDPQWQSHLIAVCQNGNEESCHYDEILERLKSNAGIINRIHSEEDDGYEIEVNTLIINDLTSLISFHKDQLDMALENEADTHIILKEHYDRALGALLSCDYYHGQTWKLVTEEQIVRNADANEHAAFVYERNLISMGAFGVALHLSDLYERYYAVYDDSQENVDEVDEEMTAAKMRKGYSHSYRFLLSCELWCDESRSLLDTIDFEKIEKHNQYIGKTEWRESKYKQQLEQEHKSYVHVTNQSCANSNVHMGTLLLDIYSVGYTLTPEDMLSYNPIALSILLTESGYGVEQHEDYADGIVDMIKTDQKRLLRLAISKLNLGIATYNEFDSSSVKDEQYSDNRINVADSHQHLGMAYQYLGDYKTSISEWRTSLDIYRTVFNEYKSTSMDIVGMASVLDIIQSLITTSQQCCYALVTLGYYDEAREVYMLNLKFRRYLKDGTSIERSLVDHDAEVPFDQDEWNNPQYSNFLVPDTRKIDESINEHQRLLDDYHKTLANNPDRTYQEVSLDIDGLPIGTLSTSDSLYEGSLRSIIGSLYLAKNDARIAKVELEMAVSLLKKGMWDEPVHDMNGDEISLPLYLADVLLNLSYAQSAINQWYSSMASYEDALDIFEKELPQSKTPSDNKRDSGDKSMDPMHQEGDLVDARKVVPGTRIKLIDALQVKPGTGIKVENFDFKRNSTNNSIHNEL